MDKNQNLGAAEKDGEVIDRSVPERLGEAVFTLVLHLAWSAALYVSWRIAPGSEPAWPMALVAIALVAGVADIAFALIGRAAGVFTYLRPYVAILLVAAAVLAVPAATATGLALFGLPWLFLASVSLRFPHLLAFALLPLAALAVRLAGGGFELDGEYAFALALFAATAIVYTTCLWTASRQSSLGALLRDAHARLEAAESQINELVMQDRTTRAFKRQFILQLCAQEKARVDRYGGKFSVCMLELDGITQVIGRHGGQVGGQLLRELSDLITKGVRQMDLLGILHQGHEPVGRIQGTQFLLVLPCTGFVGAADCAERIRRLVEQTTFRTEIGPVNMTLSVGVTEYSQGEDVETLVGRALNALLMARQAGRNRVKALAAAAVRTGAVAGHDTTRSDGRGS
ncbi:MAG TPA: GGDEF domain-containing protein [Gammaproteobacteria bacterium]|nr:GGDEF domain-containing protein [Gammaproteobacteria bacterium]